MLDFLPQTIKNALEYINIRYVYELRLRAEKPVTVNYQGKYRYLSDYGFTEHAEKAIRLAAEDISDCIFKAGKYSVYSVEEQIKQGFLTAERGVRIGLAGEYVFEKGQPLTLRNFTSVCIRVPHEVIGSGEEIYKSCMSDKVRNTLIMSSPGLGKTTILRDLGRLLSEKTQKNLLICDERGEIGNGNIGDTTDVVRFSDKKTMFEAGIRALRPDIIITDELSESDCAYVQKAVNAGVYVLASAHFSNFESLSEPFLQIFERFVLLDENQIGKIRCIYDKNGRVYDAC